MEPSPRGILIIDLQDETPGQVVATLRDHGVVVDHSDGTPAAVGFMALGGGPGLVLCALSQDVPGLVSAIAQERMSPARDLGAGLHRPPGWSSAANPGDDRPQPPPVAAGMPATPMSATGPTPMSATGPTPMSTPGPIPAAPRDSSATMLIRDPAMVQLMRQVEQVARSNATVLIIGESGTGKELIAAHLHRCSGRDGAFVAINCAGMPDALLESELFGHEQGAFFGATSRRVGKFEAANGGTLLLDEIGEMDLRMQAKVLRAVEQREIDRVGGDRPVPVDVRIVATTNRDLQQLVRLGRFRADLLFRLNVLTLKVPPLRERPADIPALSVLFARRFARANGRVNGEVSSAALQLLQQHSWPGNVRELENVMHRAVLIETGSSISAAALDLDATDRTLDAGLAVDGAAQPGTAEPPHPPAAVTVGSASVMQADRAVLRTAGRTIEAVEKDMILDTLYQSKGNRSQAAAVLGISIRTLRNKLHEYERNGTPIPRPVVVAVS
jgi:two-component system response regulator FlrC